ncbi:oxygen-dependent protoporphyrinogen oxidase [Microbotryomycetes sp. JL201]|nr:oxygen-dependent protoporphyrinogen oxidase [Microbotryomycetes sp. JL201]
MRAVRGRSTPSLSLWTRYTTSSPPTPTAAAYCVAHRQLSTSQTRAQAHEPPERTVAIIGGGLSGLASAYYIVKGLPRSSRQRTRIVVYEKTGRVGGWCHTVNMDAEAQVVFETGPRSIRPSGAAGWLTIDMAHDIGLAPRILTVPKTAPSARNRYLLTDKGLSAMPSSVLSAIASPVTTPLVRSVLPGIFKEPFQPRSMLHDRPDGGDESVDAFFKRRFGKKLADSMISAMIHGIYAGDSRRLSVKTLFPGLWEAERQSGSVIRHALRSRKSKVRHGGAYAQRMTEEKQLATALQQKLLRGGDGGAELVARMHKASVWGVQGGLGQLIQQLKTWLVTEGVEIRTGQAPALVAGNRQWVLEATDGTLSPSHVIATTPAALPMCFRPRAIPSTTVSVVNLAFQNPSPATQRLFPPGFGYLVPRTIPVELNPHRALGILFDSDVMPNVDQSSDQGLVKCSVLMGGSYWLDDGPPNADTLSHDRLVQAALETIRLHFPETMFPEPALTLTNTHYDCIPQVPPGYDEHVFDLETRLRDAQNGRDGVKLAVVGCGLANVGINGAVKHAYEVGTSFANDLEGTGQPLRLEE